MYAGNDAMMLVKAELCERLETLRALASRAASRSSAREFGDALDSLRGIAAAYGLVPVVRLADALSHAAAEGAGGPRALYLARLQDAIGCDRIDEDASQALLASVSVRLCG